MSLLAMHSPFFTSQCSPFPPLPSKFGPIPLVLLISDSSRFSCPLLLQVLWQGIISPHCLRLVLSLAFPNRYAKVVTNALQNFFLRRQVSPVFWECNNDNQELVTVCILAISFLPQNSRIREERASASSSASASAS
jgi:hypothetical protein